MAKFGYGNLYEINVDWFDSLDMHSTKLWDSPWHFMTKQFLVRFI